MHILAIDTSHGIGSVAITKDEEVISYKECSKKNQQAEQLFALIDDIFTQTKLSYNKLDSIAVDIGPGSFTGIRVGVAAARGIHLATKIPLVGITSLEALAFAYADDHKIINICLDARKGQYYQQSFNFYDNINSDINLVDYDKLSLNNDTIYIGSAKVIKENNTNINESKIIENITNASHIAEAAYIKSKNGLANLEAYPLYVRAVDAVKKG